MITLYTFGPGMGLPDPSPFVMKTEVLLKLAGLPYKTAMADVRKAPKGKLPYIDDDGRIVSDPNTPRMGAKGNLPTIDDGNTLVTDSTFIRQHLETKYGVDFDKGLSPAERAAAWAFEKLCEEHLYWGIVRARWLDDANFNAGPRKFFDKLPAPLRPLVIMMVRRNIRRSLWSQGFGRHSEADVAQLCAHDLGAIADFLGQKPYLMGAMPCGADATIFAFLTGALCDATKTPIRDAAAGRANLVAYCERGWRQWYPEFRRSA